MIKKYISLTTAKAAIFVVFVVMLVVCILFAWSARVLSVGAIDPDAQAAVAQYDSDLLLRQIDLLQNQIDNLEGQLDAAQVDLQGVQSQNEQLRNDQADIIAEMSGNMQLDYVGSFYATAYCAEVYPHICGGNGVTASGTVPTPGVTIAADWSVLPAGTWVYIEGVGVRRVEDRGSAITGNKIDVVLPTHNEALKWGNGNHNVWIITWEN